MRKLLFASHDPGGYNLIEPIIEEVIKNKTFEVFLCLSGPAYTRAKSNPILYHFLQDLITFPVNGFENEVDVDQLHYYELFIKIRPDFVLTSTSINSNLERYSLKFSKDLGIKSFVYIDSWGGKDIRFRNNLISIVPDHIFVCDDNMGSLYNDYIKSGSILSVVGNVHLEKLHTKTKIQRTENNGDKKKILFVSENILHYYPNNLVNEFSIVDNILNSYNLFDKIEIYIRPHPLESKHEWEIFINKRNNKNAAIELYFDNSSTIFNAIEKSDLVIGISSMALIEASIMGVPTFSYQIGIIDNSMLYIPFKLYNIHPIDEYNDFQFIINNLTNYQGKSNSFDFPFLGALEKIFNYLV